MFASRSLCFEKTYAICTRMWVPHRTRPRRINDVYIIPHPLRQLTTKRVSSHWIRAELHVTGFLSFLQLWLHYVIKFTQCQVIFFQILKRKSSEYYKPSLNLSKLIVYSCDSHIKYPSNFIKSLKRIMTLFERC